jgi:Fe-Mn family superoxide dismutase
MSENNGNSRDDGGFTRRSMLQGLGVAAGVTALGASGAGTAAAAGGDTETTEYALPPLPYDYDALEPAIDERIMELHHDVHHQGYVDGTNAALDRLAEMRDERDYDEIKAAKRNLSFNLSGHVLHSIFWENMSPDGGGDPSGDLADAIVDDFGSIDSFKTEFTAAASSVEGSGWGMLTYDHLADQLLVIQAEEHNDLAVQGSTPLLVVDVWEHAYYLQYEYRRGEYVENVWSVVNWDDVARRYHAARDAALLDYPDAVQ